MLNRTGYFSQEILSPDKTIVDSFKSCCFFSLERDCLQVAAVRVLCLLSWSHVQIQPPQLVPTVTRWILRATTADSLSGIKPINLANNICYKEDQLRSESLFGLYWRWRFYKQNLVHNSSGSRQVTGETSLLSAACIPLSASADVESNSKNIVRKFRRSCSGGKAEMGGVGEDYASHVSNNTSSKWREKQLCNRERRENNQTVANLHVKCFPFFSLLEDLGTEKDNLETMEGYVSKFNKNVFLRSSGFGQNLREAHSEEIGTDYQWLKF